MQEHAESPGPPGRRPWQWLLVACMGAVAVAVAWPLLPPAAGPTDPGPDFLPLYLGAHALLGGHSPVDPAALTDRVHALGIALPPGTAHLWSPYPSSAATVMIPVAYVPWQSLRTPFWMAMSGSLVVAGLAAGLSGTGLSGTGRAGTGLSGPGRAGRGVTRRHTAAFVAAAAGVIAVCGLDVAPHALALGQVNPLLVALLALAAIALVRGYDIVAGVLIAVGTGVKYVPVVLLLPALLLWRPRVLAAAAVTGLALVVGTFLHDPTWSPPSDVARGLLQATRSQLTTHPPWGGLWKYRVVPFGAVSLAAVAALGGSSTRPGAMGAAVGMTLAFVAGVAGGLSPPHEMLLVAPALVVSAGWLAETGWRLLPAVCAFAVALAALSPLDRYPQADMTSQGHAQPLIYLAYVLALARVAVVLRAPAVEVPEPRNHARSG